jgi:hypothetical protein
MKKRMPIHQQRWQRRKCREPRLQKFDMFNDPIHACNPIGFPRIVWENSLSNSNYPQGRMRNCFNGDDLTRAMDGRAQPPSGDALDSLAPAGLGSRSRWEGNTLVVESTGLMKEHVDQYGHPLSFDAKITERYTRVGPDTIDAR